MATTRHNKALAAYFVILTVLCASFIAGAKLLGQQGNFLAGLYMLTPAIAAILTRLFFYEHHFADAQLRPGKASDFLRFWLFSLGITVLQFAVYTLLGSISWDFFGSLFLEQLGQQFAAVGQNMQDSLPPGVTPQMMLWLYFAGGLTVFNILPGIISGFGEEFGHRGFMFPLLYRIKPWIGLVVGGLIWFAWHWPLALIATPAADMLPWQRVVDWGSLAVGSICTMTYLAYVYVKSGSVWVTAVAHIAMNNASRSFAYFAVVREAWLADVGLTLVMVAVVAVLYFTKELDVFKRSSVLAG